MQLHKKFSGVVQAGPLRGLQLGDDPTWAAADLGPMLLGTYEQNVIAAIGQLSANAKVLVDALVFKRPLAEAIADTRFHFFDSPTEGEPDVIEAEDSLPADVVAALKERGWGVDLKEAPGTGRFFGGVNAVLFNADGTLTGLADQRRTNAAAGY